MLANPSCCDVFFSTHPSLTHQPNLHRSILLNPLNIDLIQSIYGISLACKWPHKSLWIQGHKMVSRAGENTSSHAYSTVERQGKKNKQKNTWACLILVFGFLIFFLTATMETYSLGLF